MQDAKQNDAAEEMNRTDMALIGFVCSSFFFVADKIVLGIRQPSSASCPNPETRLMRSKSFEGKSGAASFKTHVRQVVIKWYHLLIANSTSSLNVHTYHTYSAFFESPITGVVLDKLKTLISMCDSNKRRKIRCKRCKLFFVISPMGRKERKRLSRPVFMQKDGFVITCAKE